MNPYVGKFLVYAEEFREVNMLPKNAIVTLSIPQWVYDELGEESLVLLNLEFINVDVRA